MEYPLDQENKEAAAVQEVPYKEKGGFKTIPFIIANEIFEKVANIGLVVNMIIYLTKEYHMKPATGASVIFIWLAGSNFTPIFGAFLADSYLGRYRVIAFGSFICLSGMIMLWMTANIRGARPPSCGESYALSKCESPNASQLAFLFSSFALMSLGSGGIRPCSLAFGADQLSNKKMNNNNPKKERTLQTFFNWYYASVGFSIVLASTVIVYIQDKKGFKVGFGVPVVLMFLSACFFLLGSGFYIKVEEKKNILLGFFKVLVLSYKNKGLNLPPNDHGVVLYHHRKGSNLMVPSEKLRFLNKACMIRENIGKDMKEGDELSWIACTIEQVEEVKSVLRVAPIWSTGIVMAIIINQHSFPVLQAKTMDRHLTSNFQIPAGSFGVSSVLTLIIWVTIYDRVIVPHISKFTGRPRGLTFKQRMGIGLVFSSLTMMVAAIVEAKRRKISMRGLTSDGNTTVLDMSAMWLLPQYCIIGLAEAFNIIGQIEFYYSEFPKSMASFAMALYPLGSGIGNLLGSLIIEMIDKFTKNKEKKVSWVASNLNQGHYDYYYWVLAILGIVNYLYFLVCCWAYGEEGMNAFGTGRDNADMKQEEEEEIEMRL